MSHRGRLVWDFAREQRGRIGLELLPAYAPELNPVEYLWSHWKQYELPNFCPKSIGELSHYARKALRRMRRRPTLVMASWERAELFPLYLYYSILNRSRRRGGCSEPFPVLATA